MILAFLRGDIDTRTERRDVYLKALLQIRTDRSQLIDLADLENPGQNDERRTLLGAVRGYGRDLALFAGFPDDTTWRLVTVRPAEIKSFKYAKCEPWASLSGGFRLVADGMMNLDQAQFSVGNVLGIAARVRQGDPFPALIAAQRAGASEVVLMEGHTRATAYALTGSPDKIEVIIGTSARMGSWPFF